MSDTELQPQVDQAAPETTPPEPKRAPNPREEMMRSIVERYETEQLPADLARGDAVLADSGTPEEPEPAVPPPAAPPTSPEPAAPVEEPPAAPPPAAATSPQLRSIQMPNGQVFHVTDEQFVQLAQRGVLATAAIEQQRHAPQPQPQAQPQPIQQQPTLARERAAEIAQRLTYGSPEDAAAALQDLVASVQPSMPAFDPVRLEEAAAARALQAMGEQQRLQSDLSVIGQEYPVIFSSRALAVGAAAELQEIRQRDAALGVNRPAIEQYREACNSVTQQLPQQLRSNGSAAAANPQTLQAADEPGRLERKRAVPRNPVGVSRAASLGEPEQRVSGSQIVERMRAQRHQPAMN